MNNITNQDREIFKQIKAQFPNSYYRKSEVIVILEKLTDVDTVVNKIRFMTLDLTYIPVCKTCGKELLNYNNSFCNNFCVASNNELSFKKKQTCIEKYGVDNPAKSAKD